MVVWVCNGTPIYILSPTKPVPSNRSLATDERGESCEVLLNSPTVSVYRIEAVPSINFTRSAGATVALQKTNTNERQTRKYRQHTCPYTCMEGPGYDLSVTGVALRGHVNLTLPYTSSRPYRRRSQSRPMRSEEYRGNTTTLLSLWHARVDSTDNQTSLYLFAIKNFWVLEPFPSSPIIVQRPIRYFVPS